MSFFENYRVSLSFSEVSLMVSQRFMRMIFMAISSFSDISDAWQKQALSHPPY